MQQLYTMSDSITDSGHDTNLSLETSNAGSTDVSDTIGRIEHIKSQNFGDDVLLPELPSHKFRYSVWHELRQTCLTGDQLHAPRVRAGPPVKEKQFRSVIENGLPIHHDLEGRRRQNHMNQTEKWEEARVINLCYQELSDKYQRNNFYRILSRCLCATTINLSYNNIWNLSKITFPSCEYINLHSNYLTSFIKFPYIPRVKKIIATNNNINTLNGLEKLKGTPLQELYLGGNDVSFEINYRQSVFDILPNLQVLDGIPKLPEDSIWAEDPQQQEKSKCTVL